MPRYFFDVRDHTDFSDDVGEELSGPREARAHAIIFAGSILRDEPEMMWDGREFSVEVHDADGKTVSTIYVSAVDES